MESLSSPPLNGSQIKSVPSSQSRVYSNQRSNEDSKDESEKGMSIMKIHSSSEVNLDFASSQKLKKPIEKLKFENSVIGAQSKLTSSVQPQKNNQFQEYDHVYKIILIGSSFTGKTSLLIRFVNDSFDTNYLNTVGVDLKSQTLKIHDILARINIWDTTGQEKFKSLTKAYFRNCQGAIAVFDLTKKESLHSVESQIREFRNHCPEEAKDNIVLIGNKVDLVNDRQVSYQEGKDLCRRLELTEYYETSASSNENVDKAFFSVTMKAYEIDKQQQESDLLKTSGKNQFKKNGRTSTSLQLQNNYESPRRKSKGKCCS